MQEVEGGGGDTSTLVQAHCDSEHEEPVRDIRDTEQQENGGCQ